MMASADWREAVSTLTSHPWLRSRMEGQHLADREEAIGNTLNAHNARRQSPLTVGTNVLWCLTTLTKQMGSKLRDDGRCQTPSQTRPERAENTER